MKNTLGLFIATVFLMSAAAPAVYAEIDYHGGGESESSDSGEKHESDRAVAFGVRG